MLVQVPAPAVRHFAHIAVVASVCLTLSGAWPVRGPALALLVVRYWPHALMLIGGTGVLSYGAVVRRVTVPDRQGPEEA